MRNAPQRGHRSPRGGTRGTGAFPPVPAPGSPEPGWHAGLGILPLELIPGLEISARAPRPSRGWHKGFGFVSPTDPA